MLFEASAGYFSNNAVSSSEEADENEKDAFKAMLEDIEMNKAYKNERHLRQTNETYSFILPDEYPKEFELAQSRRTMTITDEEKRHAIQNRLREKKRSEFLRLLNSLDT